MQKYIVERHNQYDFAIFEIKRSLIEPVAVFDCRDEALAHRVCEFMNANGF